MCLTPVKIPNPRKFIRPELDPAYQLVPCGHCEECKEMKVNDWFVRLNYELIRCRKLGGCGYFLTLTFSDDMVPRVCDKDFEELFELFSVSYEPFSGMCFDKAALSQFLQDFRDIIREKYGVSGLKFFVVTEFGSDEDKTHRPHYHIIIFSPATIAPPVVRSLANYCWSKRVKFEDVPKVIKEQAELPAVQEQLKRGNYNVLMRWIIAPPASPRHKKPLFKIRYGFTSWSRDYGAIIQTSGCLKYVLKYVFKDADFMRTKTAVMLDRLVKHFPTLDELEQLYPPLDPMGNPDYNYQEQLSKGPDFFKTNPEFTRIHNLMQRVRDCMPFHLQSQKIGDDLFQEIVSDWQHGKEILRKNEITFDNCSDGFVYRVPRYIIRRLFYSVGKEQQNTHYNKYRNYVYLNEIGKECLCDFLDYRLEIFYKQIQMYLSPVYVSMMSSDSVCGWLSKHKTSLNQSLSELRRLSKDDIFILFYYKYVFRGVTCFYLDNNILQYDKQKVLDVGKRMFYSKVHTQDLRKFDDYMCYHDTLNCYHLSEFDKVPPIIDSAVIGYKRYADIFVFQEFEKYITWFDAIRDGVKTYKCQSDQEKKDRSKLLRSIYNKFIYSKT